MRRKKRLGVQSRPPSRPYDVGDEAGSENDYVQIVSLLLTNRAEVNAVGPEGRTPLHFAATFGCLPIAEILLGHGADVKAGTVSGKTPLHPAATFGDDHLVVLPLAARPYSSVMMVVNPDTAAHLTESVEFLLEEGARYLILSLNHAGPWTEETLEVLRTEYEKLARRYVAWTRAGRKFYLSPFEVKLSSHVNRHCYQKDRCELGRRQFSVDPEGWLYPCVQFVKGGPASRWCIGRVGTVVDEAARQRIHAESDQEKPECRECALRLRCNNSCGCLNWQTTGSVNAISPTLCRHEQMLMPIADRLGRELYRQRDPHFLHKHYNAAYPVLSMIEDALSSQGKP